MRVKRGQLKYNSPLFFLQGPIIIGISSLVGNIYFNQGHPDFNFPWPTCCVQPFFLGAMGQIT